MATRDHYETSTGLEYACADMREETEKAAAYVERVGRLMECMEDSCYRMPKNSPEYYQLAETIVDCRKLLIDAMEGVEI